MKLRFEQTALAFATATTQSVANPQSSLPILGNILISATKESVTFESSDMESCVRCTVAAEIIEPGSITVPARTLHESVRAFPEGPVDFEATDSLAVITGGDNKYQLTTQTPEDFPTWPDLQAGTTISLEQATLRRVLDHVLFAVPIRDPRKVLLGALFEIENGELVCGATDARKLGQSRCAIQEVSGAQPASVIIPQKILGEVQRNLKEEGMARLLIGERQIAFDLGNLLYLSNRIDGVYPNYHSRIPEEFTRQVRLNRSLFLEKVRSAGAISEERNNSIIMRFQSGRVQFSARTYEVGSYEGSMEVAYEGEPFDLAFNHIYLAEVMRVVDSEEMVMKVFRNTSPVVFTAPEHEQSLFVVMPITLSSIAETEEA